MSMIMSLPDRAWSYIVKMPRSMQGQNGSTALYNVACVLVRGFALPEEECLRLLERWNEAMAEPPWSVPELRHKLKDAHASGRREGYLLDPSPEEGRTDAARAWALTRKAAPSRPRTGRRQGPPPDPAMLRARWQFEPVTPEDVAVIAKLRHATPGMVHLFWRKGLLRNVRVDGVRCWALVEGTLAQARRYDGGLLTIRHGGGSGGGTGTGITATLSKCKTLPGSQGHFVGSTYLKTGHPVLMVEGVVGLLEAASLIDLANAAWLPFAAVSAGARFASAPAELRERFRGRRVRIVPDEGPAGLRAACAWLAELEAAGAVVEIFALPPGLKDLGPVLQEPERHAALIDSIFS